MRYGISIAAGIGLLAAGCSSAPAVRSTPPPAYAAPAAAAAASLAITLSAEQAALVRPYLARPGRGRRSRLPPGIARNLERGKPLPPGIAKRYLPGRVIADLPRLPSGLDYVVVAGKLLLVETATAVVRDVLLDVAFDR